MSNPLSGISGTPQEVQQNIKGEKRITIFIPILSALLEIFGHIFQQIN